MRTRRAEGGTGETEKEKIERGSSNSERSAPPICDKETDIDERKGKNTKDDKVARPIQGITGELVIGLQPKDEQRLFDDQAEHYRNL
jgi:hypothetical protein